MDNHFEELIGSFCRETSYCVGPSYFRVRKLEFELLRMLEPGYFSHVYERALELGCGIGFKALLTGKFARHIDAVDLDVPYHGFQSDQRAVDIGRKAMERIGVENIDFFAADYVEFMTKNVESYDLVYSDYLLEHVPNVPALCQAMFSCLRNGGRILHVVPNTHDALIQLVKENLQSSFRGLLRVLKGYLNRILKGEKRHPKITASGLFVPITHSEFLEAFSDQLEVYRLEHYVFSMIEAGFMISAIHPTREHSFAIFAQKISSCLEQPKTQSDK